uniref:t-SNARE coiled-coil homology domain-containing protein n=1 Tax=Chromera velia CCMP2878 TaxID=1169474 RepID=A0A0G4GNL1_9ALVE|eukprot:Cvel_4958.t1-p1 / transcript=Cvel_4958.t1 / gene=Cvel_4958 / organism=Chromera_velia_CCMP2878 / gene_product=hypothetical protein / transcript_product=hypothetical protein / location=Cvel_scaffold224:33037-36667(-) / protein_length=486 / sequence_SO=supercontig / SO=protein_coding / is_pseudo=false
MTACMYMRDHRCVALSALLLHAEAPGQGQQSWSGDVAVDGNYFSPVKPEKPSGGGGRVQPSVTTASTASPGQPSSFTGQIYDPQGLLPFSVNDSAKTPTQPQGGGRLSKSTGSPAPVVAGKSPLRSQGSMASSSSPQPKASPQRTSKSEVRANPLERRSTVHPQLGTGGRAAASSRSPPPGGAGAGSRASLASPSRDQKSTTNLSASAASTQAAASKRLSRGQSRESPYRWHDESGGQQTKGRRSTVNPTGRATGGMGGKSGAGGAKSSASNPFEAADAMETGGVNTAPLLGAQGHEGPSGGEGGLGKGPLKVAAVLDDNQVEERILRERQRGMQQLQRDIHDIHGLYTDLNLHVTEQGTMIDNIESQMNNAAVRTAQATEEIQEARRRQRRYQKRVLYMTIIGVIVLVIGIIILCQYLPSGKKNGNELAGGDDVFGPPGSLWGAMRRRGDEVGVSALGDRGGIEPLPSLHSSSAVIEEIGGGPER